MDRKKIIKELLKKRKSKVYLEIGVHTGNAFFPVKSASKYAVDPEFKFSRTKRIRRTLFNPYNFFARFYQTTSDDFFNKTAPTLFRNKKIDVCLVDGMHEYSFALCDIENTLNYLSDDGVIIVHDCNPPTKEQAVSFQEYLNSGANRVWNGDVWKAILHLRSLRSDINVFVLDCDHGLGIVTKRKPEHMLGYSLQEINSFSFDDFANRREEWLNLKPASYFSSFLHSS